jgi:hypothetical protein
MPEPSDPALYARVKEDIYIRIPKHSAYRSGILVKTYKSAFAEKYGARASPYIGERVPNTGLSRWFAEEWRNQRGEVGYKYKSDIYRPTRRITARTPTTFNELSSSQISRARAEKSRRGRVRRFA